MTNKQRKMLKRFIPHSQRTIQQRLKEVDILKSIQVVSAAVEVAKVKEVIEKKEVNKKSRPLLLKATSIKVFDEEGRELTKYRALVREDKHEQLFSIVTESYKIAQHEEIVDKIEHAVKELELNCETTILSDMDKGARIRMVTSFPGIQIKIKDDLFTMRLSWDNSYNLTTGVRLVLGALSPHGYELFVDAKYANFYHRHTKGLDLKHVKGTINKGIDVFKSQVEKEFNKMIDTPMTMEKAINFLDNCCTEKVIAEVYLSALKQELQKIPADELDSQFVLYNLINKVLGERVKSIDTKERHIRAMNTRLKAFDK